MPEITLPVAASQLGKTPVALIEAALRGGITLHIWQTGWRWDSADVGWDAPLFVWADNPLLDLQEPPQLRPGLVPLLPEHLDQLRNGRVFIREIEDRDSGLRVRLASPVWIGWEGVLITGNEWARFKTSATAAQLPQLPSTAATSSTNGMDNATQRTAEAAERMVALLETRAGCEAVPPAEEILALLRPLLASDTAQGLAALKGHKTLLRLLLGVLPAHTAAELLPGTDRRNENTLRSLGLVRSTLANRGGAVVLDRLRAAVADGEVGIDPSTLEQPTRPDRPAPETPKTKPIGPRRVTRIQPEDW